MLIPLLDAKLIVVIRVVSVKKWYLIKTKPRQENIAKQNLENQGYVAFCPIAKINNQLVVLFPGYIFVKLSKTKQNWSPVNSTRGVSHFVRFGLDYARVPSNVIEFIKTNQDNTADKLIKLNKFKSGDKVQISDGALKNCLAIFTSYKPDERVTLLLNILGRKQSIDIKKDFVNAL